MDREKESYVKPALCIVLVNHTQLVDPASVYMLVSKTKPCMSKYSSVE